MVVREFEFQSRYYVYFQTNNLEKDKIHFIHLAMGLIASLQFF